MKHNSQSNLSEAEIFSLLPLKEQNSIISGLSNSELEALYWDWKFNARPAQNLPDIPFDTWLLLAGRGFGKTRIGSETVREWVCGSTPLSSNGVQYVALIAETSKDARDVMIEGDSGLLACHPPAFRPIYEPSKKRLTWPNGARGYIYNGTEPNQLRGPQFDKAWCDEIAKFTHVEEVWNNLTLGLRKGDNPQVVVTTTPRPMKFLRTLRDDFHTVVTTGSSYDNASNLSPNWFRKIREKYEGTRLGRQELHAEIIDDNPYALWNLGLIDEGRIGHKEKLPSAEQMVIAVDPPVTTGENADECGIIAGFRSGEDYYIINDKSCQGLSPTEWASRAVSLYHTMNADCIVAEVNQGGDLVEAVIRQVDANVPIKLVRATRGKVVRAEPIAALYEKRRVHHVGSFATLEDQMCDFTSDFDKKKSGYSPDRVDALVWLLAKLSGRGQSIEPRIRSL